MDGVHVIPSYDGVCVIPSYDGALFDFVFYCELGNLVFGKQKLVEWWGKLEPGKLYFTSFYGYLF